MKTGFVMENHVVIYCEGCGDYYREHEGESICFDSIDQASEYLSARGVSVGWVYDGHRVLCDGCVATEKCARNGHEFPDSWLTVRRALGISTRSRTCTVCGIAEIEALP